MFGKTLISTAEYDSLIHLKANYETCIAELNSKLTSMESILASDTELRIRLEDLTKENLALLDKSAENAQKYAELSQRYADATSYIVELETRIADDKAKRSANARKAAMARHHGNVKKQ